MENSKNNSIVLDDETRGFYRLMAPDLKRTCLSPRSAITGIPNVIDVPLGAKLPMVPGSRLQLYTAYCGTKLLQPSCDFDRTYPSDVYISNEYRCLHDTHLRHYFQRKGMAKMLQQKDFITYDNKVVCSLKEYNLYRQYLKHLSIEYFNKIYREKYEKDLEKARELANQAIKDKKKDPNNPITLRINQCRKIRNKMERARDAKGRKVLKLVTEEKEARLKRKNEEMQKRIKEEIRREIEREHWKKIKINRAEQQQMMKEEILFYKHKEEFCRNKELEERKKTLAREKQRKLDETYERKKRFHHMKMIELQALLAEEEIKKKNNVQNWKNYFARKIEKQQKKLKALLERDRLARVETNRRIEDSLRRRGWSGAQRYFPPVPEVDPFEKAKKKRGKKVSIGRLSALGFHSAVVPDEILGILWDGSVSSDEGIEHSAGDALPAGPSLSTQEQSHLKHVRNICDDAITKARAQVVVDNIVSQARNIQEASVNITQQAIDISRDVLLPLLQTYEERTGIKIPDSEIPDTLRDLCNGVLDEKEGDLAPLMNFGAGKTSIRAGRQDSAIRFVVSHTDLPMSGVLGFGKQNRPPTPKAVRFFDDSDSTLDEFLEMSESQLVLEDTIKALSAKIVDHVFDTALASNMTKEDMQGRITHLANSVVQEIFVYGQEEAIPPPRSSSSESSSTNSRASLDRKLSCLATAMINDLVRDRAQPLEYSAESADNELTPTGSDISALALDVVRSAVKTVNTDKEAMTGNEIYNKLEPLINDLSSNMVDKIINERQQELNAPLELKDKNDYIELESKISKLALSIVGSVLHGAQPSSSSSKTSLSSVTLEARVNDVTAQIVGAILGLKKLLPRPDPNEENDSKKDKSAEAYIEDIINIKALLNAPRKLFRRLNEKDVVRIGNSMTRKMVPQRSMSSLMSSGINELAVALTEKAITRIATESSVSSIDSSLSLEGAMKLLADTLVKESLQDSAKISSETKSAISSGIDDLAHNAATKAIEKNLIISDSEISSAASDLAKNVVANTLTEVSLIQSSTESALSSGASALATKTALKCIQDAQQVGSSSESALSSGASTLAIHVVRDSLHGQLGETMPKKIESSEQESVETVGGTTCSVLSSGASELADNTVSQMLVGEKLPDLATSANEVSIRAEDIGSTTKTSVSTAVSVLASHITKRSVVGTEIGSSELESVLSSAVSRIIVETLSRRVADIIQTQSSTQLNVGVLVEDIADIVRGLLDSHNSCTSKSLKNSANESPIKEEVAREVSTLLSSSDQTSLSSAASALANDIVQKFIDHKKLTDSVSNKRSSKSNTEITKSTETLGKVASSNAVITKKPGAVTKSQTSYGSSFANWRSQIELKSPENDESVKANERTLKVYGTTSTLNKSGSSNTKEESPKSSEPVIEGVLDELATRIVGSVTDGNNNTGADVINKLNDSGSVEKLVETLALGVVSSILGLDLLVDSSPKQSRPASTESEAEKSAINDDNDNVAPMPSMGASRPHVIKSIKACVLPRPTAPIPGKRVHSTSSYEELKKYEALEKLLGSRKDYQRKAATDYDDFSHTHPHRIPSPDLSIRKKSMPHRKVRAPKVGIKFDRQPSPPTMNKHRNKITSSTKTNHPSSL